MLRIEYKKGILNFEFDVDLVFFDDDFNVYVIFIVGELVWLKKEGLVIFAM